MAINYFPGEEPFETLSDNLSDDTDSDSFVSSESQTHSEDDESCRNGMYGEPSPFFSRGQSSHGTEASASYQNDDVSKVSTHKWEKDVIWEMSIKEKEKLKQIYKDYSPLSGFGWSDRSCDTLSVEKNDVTKVTKQKTMDINYNISNDEYYEAKPNAKPMDEKNLINASTKCLDESPTLKKPRRSPSPIVAEFSDDDDDEMKTIKFNIKYAIQKLEQDIERGQREKRNYYKEKRRDIRDIPCTKTKIDDEDEYKFTM